MCCDSKFAVSPWLGWPLCHDVHAGGRLGAGHQLQAVACRRHLRAHGKRVCQCCCSESELSFFRPTPVPTTAQHWHTSIVAVSERPSEGLRGELQGARDHILSGESTFFVELSETASMLQVPGDRDLQCTHRRGAPAHVMATSGDLVTCAE
jgi:hypothetical protein